MASDMDVLIELLKRWGVGFREEGFDIICEPGLHEKVVGENGLFVKYRFDSEGNFLHMETW